MTKGWDNKPLAEVSSLNYGYTESASSEPIGPRFLRITDIQDDRVNWDTVPYCKIDKADIAKYRLATGDIVFARTGATTGKSFLIESPPDAVFASYLIRLRLLDKRLSPKFVSLFFQSDDYWETVKAGSAGSAQGGFNATKLGALRMPIPPLPEQRRIVGILDEAFAGIATAKANAEKNLRNAQAIFDSALDAVFAQPSEGWKQKVLKDIGTTQTGSTPKTSDPANYGDFIPFVKPGDFQTNGAVDYDNEGLSQQGMASARVIPANSVLMVCIGATIGKCGVCERDITTNQQINALVPNASAFYKFVYFQMLTDAFQKLVMHGSGQATLPIINKGKWSALPMWLPKTIEEQRHIAAEFEVLCREVQRLASLYQQKLAALDALKKSLLHQAFSGQLTS